MNEAEEIEIEGIRETIIKELEEIEIEKINKIKELERIARKKEFYELTKCLNFNLRIESKKAIRSIAEYISDGKNLKIKPIDLSIKKMRSLLS